MRGAREEQVPTGGMASGGLCKRRRPGRTYPRARRKTRFSSTANLPSADRLYSMPSSNSSRSSVSVTAFERSGGANARAARHALGGALPS